MASACAVEEGFSAACLWDLDSGIICSLQILPAVLILAKDEVHGPLYKGHIALQPSRGRSIFSYTVELSKCFCNFCMFFPRAWK